MAADKGIKNLTLDGEIDILWPMLEITTFPKSSQIKRQWHLLDASSDTLGRMCTRAAGILRGKHKVIFSPHVDCGDFVVIINASKLRLTGQKLESKVKFHHSGYPGGGKYVTYKSLFKERPERIISSAVSGMLPKNKFRKIFMKRLKVYREGRHPHSINSEVNTQNSKVETKKAENSINSEVKSQNAKVESEKE